MPYSSLDSLPDSVKKLPKNAQEVWMSAFNSAFSQYKGDETKSFAVAWSAVKKAGYETKESNVRLFDIRQVSKCKAFVGEGGFKYIEVPVSGVRKDRDGDSFGFKAGNSMIRAYKSKTIPMFSNHGLDHNGQKSYRWQDILGGYVDGYWAENKLDIWAKCKLNPKNKDAELLYDYVESGMPVGFSIGGDVAKSFSFEKAMSMSVEKDYIDDIDLFETSPVGIPAYSYAVNKSFSDQFTTFMKDKEVDSVPEDVKVDTPKPEPMPEPAPAVVPEPVKPAEKVEEDANKETQAKIDEKNDKVSLSKEELEGIISDAVGKALADYKPETRSIPEANSKLAENEKNASVNSKKTIGELGADWFRSAKND